MAIRNILKDHEDTLRKKSKIVEKFDQKLWTLLDDMKDTMRLAEGVGLAAPQVGMLKRVAIIDISGDGTGLIELINPEITFRSDDKQIGDEGCLSSPGEYGLVARPMTVTVKALDRNGMPVEHTGEGLFARAVCHEVDHLDGILFKDLVIDPPAEGKTGTKVKVKRLENRGK